MCLTVESKFLTKNVSCATTTPMTIAAAVAIINAHLGCKQHEHRIKLVNEKEKERERDSENEV